jgi:predicted DNA-binding transcriptional regulator AlpA
MNDLQIVSIVDAAKVINVSRATLRRLLKADQSFPRPLRIGQRRIGWRTDELNEWLSLRPRN